MKSLPGWNHVHRIGWIFAVLSLSLSGNWRNYASARSAPPFSAESNCAVLQYQSGGHVFGFKSGGVYVAAPDHLLKTEFVGARNVEPMAIISPDAGSGLSSTVMPLQRVMYAGLWDGVTLLYEGRRDALSKSTYRLAPGAAVNQIRLRYNVPVRLDSRGALSMDMGGGRFCESAPIAWQESENGRQPIIARFQRLGEREIGFSIGPHDPDQTLVIDPVLTWNTFMGGSSVDSAHGIALDSGGNIYVVGSSWETWGSPINPFSGNIDVFVAKLSSSGTLQWNTFAGGSDIDEVGGIALDNQGNILVTGASYNSWGNPLSPFKGFTSAFVAKLDSTGNRTWHTFLGEASANAGACVTSDAAGNLFVAGSSKASWGKPVNPFSGKSDAFVTKLTAAGAVQWNTFMGGPENDSGLGIALDASNNVLVAGVAGTSWGEPRRAYSGMDDAFVAKLNPAGIRLWSTFLGGNVEDSLGGIALDSSGNSYVTGFSNTTWGTPINSYTNKSDVFVAKLSDGGNLSWNTFLGGTEDDQAYSIALDVTGSILISGASGNSWGKPANAFAGGADAMVAKLSAAGLLIWNTFLGSSDFDNAYGVALDNSGSVFVCGSSESTWGIPINPFKAGNTDAYAAKIFDEQFCLPLSITTQPKSTNVRSGESATLTVAVSGTPKIRYQWYQGFKGDTTKPASGNTANTNTFITPPLTAASRYWVRVANDCSFADSNTATVAVLPEFLVGSWSESGVWYLDSEKSQWVPMASAANRIAAGDLDGDGIADLVGTWNSGVWTKQSSTGEWILLATPASSLSVADFNGDGKEDLLGIWNSVIWLLDSATRVWSSISAGATRVTAGDMDGDGKADIIAVWPDSGIWVKYSSTGQWILLTTPANEIAAGDMNGDGRADLVGIWSGHVWTMDAVSLQWLQITFGASRVALGDLDGDGRKDLIGVWPNGVWVKKSASGDWQLLSSPAESIAVGRMR